MGRWDGGVGGLWDGVGVGGNGAAGDAQALRIAEHACGRCAPAPCRYEQIRDLMREELNRFQKERAAELTNVLRDFALAQARHTAEQAKAWGMFLNDLHGGVS